MKLGLGTSKGGSMGNLSYFWNLSVERKSFPMDLKKENRNGSHVRRMSEPQTFILTKCLLLSTQLFCIQQEKYTDDTSSNRRASLLMGKADLATPRAHSAPPRLEKKFLAMIGGKTEKR